MTFYGIRGAITVDRNTPEDILEGTTLLLRELLDKNSIDKEDIISIIFSATGDLDSEYPAVAARELGMVDIPLFCCQEMYVKDSLDRCIRVLLHIRAPENMRIKHIYLRKARELRPDLISQENQKDRVLTIAIDGPAGAGKSTISKIIADSLDILYLDTGAMYRAIAYKALNEGLMVNDAKGIIGLLETTSIDVEYRDRGQRTILDGQDITTKIRTPEISEAASAIAVIPEVRLYLTELQREIAKDRSLVMDGRDIGTYVLPDAPYKFFLTASLEERAARRWKEMAEKGLDKNIETIKGDIEERDKKDETRAFAPLRRAHNSILIDTTGKSIEQVTNEILGFIGPNPDLGKEEA